MWHTAPTCGYCMLWAVLYSIIMREQHIDFIRKDLKERGEIPTSDITFFGAIYSLKVKKEGGQTSKNSNLFCCTKCFKWVSGYFSIAHNGIGLNAVN